MRQLRQFQHTLGRWRVRSRRIIIVLTGDPVRERPGKGVYYPKNAKRNHQRAGGYQLKPEPPLAQRREPDDQETGARDGCTQAKRRLKHSEE